MLFADDERSLQELMRLELPRRGFNVTVCPDGTTAVASLDKNTFDCAILDLDMPGLHGLEVMRYIRENSPETACVVLTGKQSIESAVDALRQGAFDYLAKPCKLMEIEALLHRVAEKKSLVNQCRAAKHQLEQKVGAPRLVGKTPAMQRIQQLIEKVAPTHSTVLVRGETGTGKELVARAVHDLSERAAAPFVTVNCGALPENLIESELFGHRKGAFTGADEHRVGLFEVANEGTLFLDEIGELPKAMQAKLLRVLESGEVRRVGENEPFQVDVRVVCATHRDLAKMVEEDDFRQDLMFRINTFELLLPPLRERIADLPLLVAHLLKRFMPHCCDADTCVAPKAKELLERHTWPGNVRELANVIEHATILCNSPPIRAEHLPQLQRSPKASPFDAPLTLRQVEVLAVQRAIERHEGNKPKAAEELGVSLKTLYNKLSQAEILEKSA